MTFIIFTLDGYVEIMERIGEDRANAFAQAFGEKVNSHFGQGGISYQMTRNQFAAIANNVDKDMTIRSLEAFVKELLNDGLSGVSAAVCDSPESRESIYVRLLAGVGQGSHREDIQIAEAEARANQKEIVRFLYSDIVRWVCSNGSPLE
jgi:GGDEF domain-containing protein